MDESPKRVQRPGRPGEESGVLELPSLTDQMDVTMDVEGEVTGNSEAVRLTDSIGSPTNIDDTLSLLTRQRYTHYRAQRVWAFWHPHGPAAFPTAHGGTP